MKLKQLEKKIIFIYAIDFIESHNRDFSETGKAYIKGIKDFFDDVKKGLESVINPKEEYFFVKNLREIYNVISGKEKISKCKIKGSIKKIDKTRKQLDDFSEDPEKFYQDKKASENLLNIFKKIKQIY